ncbi:putative leader peptide [Streptomyces caniscabiei]|nr:putative leader peptide [Streptomyces sp. FxanaA7]
MDAFEDLPVGPSALVERRHVDLCRQSSAICR